MPAKSHGLSRKIPEYRAWINMKSRCYNSSVPDFARYGGRGISVCDRWLHSFAVFFEDVGPRPTPAHSLDRWPNPDGNYEPDNVRWATQQEQTRNFASYNRMVVVEGYEITLAEAAEKALVPYNTVLYRLKRGWSIEDAIRFPARKGHRPHAA